MIIKTANSVSKAWKILNEFDPMILVSDIAMPEEDGFELIRRIRNSPEKLHKIPAIALTAYVSKEDMVKSLKSGFQAHIGKPVDSAVLAETIIQLLGK
jgi:CheY-like chemotaxis protein